MADLIPPAPAPVQPYSVETGGWSKTKTGPSATWKELSDRGIKAGEDYDKAAAAGVAAQVKQREHAEELRRIELEKAEKAEAVHAKSEQKKLQEAQLREKRLEEMRGKEAAARESLDAAAKNRDTGYWDDKSTGARILSAFLVGIGEFAHYGQGGPSPARQILDAAVARDREVKLGRYEAASKRLSLAKDEREKMAVAHERDVENQHLVSLAKLERQAELAKLRVPSRANAIDQGIAEMRQKQAEIVRGQEESIARQVTSGHETKTDSRSSQTVQGEKSAPAGGGEVAMKARGLLSQAEGYDRTLALIEQSPDRAKAALEALRETEREKRAPMLLKAARNLVGSPTVAEKLGDDPVAKEIATGLGTSAMGFLQSQLPGEAVTSDREAKAFELSGISEMNVDQLRARLRQQAKTARELAGQGVPSEPPKASATPATPATPTTPALTRSAAIDNLQKNGSADDKRAFRWLMTNPKSASAEGVRRALRAKGMLP